MRRIFGLTLCAFVGVLALAEPASAQVVKTVTDFENIPGATDFVSEAVFRYPDFSGSTRGITTVGVSQPNTYITAFPLSFPPFHLDNSGDRSLLSFWKWEDPGDHTSWVRLTTNNTEFFPNPSLHLEGKVRLWMGANAWTDDLFVNTTSFGNLLVGLGVRETGLGVPLGADGDIIGPIEWVGLSDFLVEILAGTNGVCDTMISTNGDDVQVVNVGTNATTTGVCVDAGTDGVMQTTAVGDDVFRTTPVGKFSVPTDGVMRLYEFDLPMAQSNGEVFPFTGDGALGATPNNRGVLEHLVITNDPANLAADAEVIYFFVDDVEFEAPVPSPPSIVVDPAPVPLDESVALENIDPTADLVEIIQLPGTTLFSGPPNPPMTTSMVASTGLLPALVELVARQRVGGVFSDDSSSVLVQSPGNAPLRLAASVRETDEFDHGLMCGDSGSGFNPSGAATLEYIGATSVSSFTVPDGRTFSTSPDWQEVTFNPCVDGITAFSGNGVIDLNTDGVPPPAGDTVGTWSDLFFRIDDALPSQGPFTVYIDDLTVKNADSNGMDCMIDDFESYIPGPNFIIQPADGNGTADTVAAGDDNQVISVGFAATNGAIIIDPGPDGVLDSTTNGDDVVASLRARFQFPSAAGGSVGLAGSPDVSQITDERGFVSSNSLKIEFGFVDTNINNSLRLTTNVDVGAQVPETMISPNTVIPLEFFPCDDGQDAVMSFMMLLEPPPVPGDCNSDGDIDLEDAACFQLCMGQSPVQPECEKVSLAPNGAPDNIIDLDDYALFNFLVTGPK